MRGKRRERAADERVGGVALDAESVRGGLDLDPVGEREPLVDGQQLVPAVVAQWADDEAEVDLRGSRRLHPSASASATNSGGASASARTAGSRPIRASAAAASSRDATPASSSELGSVLRRCANAAATTRFTRG